MQGCAPGVTSSLTNLVCLTITNHHPGSFSGMFSGIAPVLLSYISLSVAPVGEVHIQSSSMQNREMTDNDSLGLKMFSSEIKDVFPQRSSERKIKNQGCWLSALNDSINCVEPAGKQPEVVCEKKPHEQNPTEFSLAEAGMQYMIGYGDLMPEENVSKSVYSVKITTLKDTRNNSSVKNSTT